MSLSAAPVTKATVVFAAGLFTLVFLALPIFASPPSASLIHVQKAKEPVNGSYVVIFRENPSISSTEIMNILSPSSEVTSHWDNIGGFAGIFAPDDLTSLRAHPDVFSIHENGVVRIATTQKDAPWGLARISSRNPVADNTTSALNFTYSYDERAGSGVDVYVLDTGILTSHPAFNGRASWGVTFGGYANRDGNGHGTHCAGIIASGPYGVAKAANVIAVKVLDDSGSGTWEDIISGLDWVATTASQKRRPSVASLSLSGDVYTPLDQAITKLVSSGVSTVVAAGNNGANASSYSPAHVPSVVTVAASDIYDSLATFSNYGSAIDVIAPGVSITSTWNNNETRVMSGTSAASPHVAGLITYFLSIDSSLTPSSASRLLSSCATTGAIALTPNATIAHTPNKLAFNHFAT